MSALKKLQSARPSDLEEIPRDAALLDMRLEGLAELCEPMSLSEADGFLAGIAVCPETVSIEDWLPAVLNLSPDVKVEAFLHSDLAESFAGLLLEGFNRVSDEIARGVYLPIANRNALDGEEFWHLWISGFEKAMALRPHSWDRFAVGDSLTRNALKGLRNLIGFRQGGENLPTEDHNAMTALAPMLIPIWVGILMSWNLSGGSLDYSGTERLNLGPSPGRNDPCSCGSGKKYKKCCYLA
jgi:uncharacterized protein